MTSEEKPKIRVAIIGAGIAGLTFSVALKWLDNVGKVEVDIYEASSTLSDIGAGINIWHRTLEVLRNIGLEETLLEMMPEESGRVNKPHVIFEVRKSDQQQGVEIRDLTMNSGPLRIHRADLQRALLSHSGGTLHLSRRLVSYTEGEDSVQLEFEDGSTAICDVLIGADGLKSAVRKIFLGHNSSNGEPVWTGSVAYRGLVAFDAIEGRFPGHRGITKPVMYCGKYKHIITYPLPEPVKMINVVAFVTNPSQEGTGWTGSSTATVMQDELLLKYRGWEDEVQALLQCIKSPTIWPIFDLTPLERFSSGRIILIGDAAHAMTPHQGTGAGQAIEDAYVLAALLTHESAKSGLIAPLGEIYNAIRCPFANNVLLASREHGKCSQLDAPGFENVHEGDLVPQDKLQALFLHLSESWDWLCTTSAEVDRDRAIQMLVDLTKA